MTVQQGLRNQESWSNKRGTVAADQITPLDRAAIHGSRSVGNLSGNEGKNRREFLTYIWAGTLAAMTAGSGLAAYQFIYPRRTINEFGGKFYLGAAADLPAIGSEPQTNVYGKFWLANTEEGLHAFYEICTHPWNGNPHKYTWDSERFLFACPMCGSKFSLEGHYIEGPAPRSLDQFVIEVVTGRKVVALTILTEDSIASPSIPSPDTEIVVDTGTTIEGLPSKDSPIDYRGQR